MNTTRDISPSPQTLATDRTRVFAHYAVFIVGGLSVFLQAFRVPVNVIAPGLDRSYPHVLNLFAFTSMRFGTDLVYTYGPLGFLMHVENVRHNLVAGFAVWFALYALFSVATTYFVMKRTSGFARLMGLLLATAVAGFIDAERLFLCLVLVLLLVSFDNRGSKPWILALCGALSSLALLMKFPIGVACAGMTIGSVVWPFEWRRASKHFAIFGVSALASLLLLWVVSSGSIAGVVAYIVNSLQLTSGYTAVMSSARVHENVILGFFGAAFALLLAMLLLLPKSHRIYACLVMLFPLFVCWKSGVVRFDGHVIALVNMAMFTGFLLCVLHLGLETAGSGEAGTSSESPRQRPTTRGIVAMALFLLACGAFNMGLEKMAFTQSSYPLLSRSYTESVGGVKDSWLPGLIPLGDALSFREYQTELGTLAATNSAPVTLRKDFLDLIGHASVDIYSYELGFIAANPGLNYRPKPIFQHFNAFTEKLDRLNGSFFASSERPDYLIMFHPGYGKIDGVDGRHALYDDPIAFLDVMQSYRPILVEDDPRNPPVALLRHVKAGYPDRFGTPRAIKEQVVKWNETIDLPSRKRASVLRARVDLARRPVPVLKEAVFRLSPMYLVYILSDGAQQRYRLAPPHLGSGVWIDPLFEDYWSLYAFLGEKPWIGPEVVAIRFETENPRDYPESFKLAWESIDCAGEGCGPAEIRLFNSTVGSPKTMPVPISSAVLARMISPVAGISAIDVRLSTYAKINPGVLTMQILDAAGRMLRESKADAASVRDNQYQLFTFEPLDVAKGASLNLRLTYAPEKEGMIAAWRTSPTAADFDFRVYGH